jgi:hypothetical protein
MTKFMKRMESTRQKTCKTSAKPVATVPAFEGGTGLAVGDMNGNDRQDIVVAPYKKGKAHIYLAEKRDGRIYKKRKIGTVPAFEGGIGLAVGDMNGNHRQDIVIAPYKDGKAHIYLVENKDGRCYKKRKIGTVPAFEGGIGLAVGDMNGDKKPDIVVAPYKAGASNVYIFLNNGDGTFSSNGRYFSNGLISYSSFLAISTIFNILR